MILKSQLNTNAAETTLINASHDGNGRVQNTDSANVSHSAGRGIPDFSSMWVKTLKNVPVCAQP